MEGTLDVGQSQLLFLPKNSMLQISNPYEIEPINFMHLWLGPASQQIRYRTARAVDFDLTTDINRLIPLNSAEETGEQINPIFLGMFEGRHEGTYRLNNPGKGIFAYVLTGAFEVQNRLIQPHDGLALWNIEELEFEALSNQAIIILAELL
jgi:hypothetical protein